VSNARWTVVNALDSSSRGIHMGLFIGVVSGSGNNVQTTLLTTLFTLSVPSQGYHSHFTHLTTLHGAYYMVTRIPSGQPFV
jgi:hypothetical protein